MIYRSTVCFTTNNWYKVLLQNFILHAGIQQGSTLGHVSFHFQSSQKGLLAIFHQQTEPFNFVT